MFGRTGQTTARWQQLVFVGTILLVGACVQLAGIDDPHPKTSSSGSGGGGSGGGASGGGEAGGGAGGAPNVELDGGPDAPPDANDGGGQPPVTNLEWANWPMPNPATTGLPNPTDYNINTGQGTVIDNVTKLMWQRSISASSFTWGDAKIYCNGLNLAGFAGWRLPTAIELISLVDFTKPQNTSTIDADAFPNTPTDWFWTATPLAKVPTSAWIVSFGSGDSSGNDGGAMFRVRCVR